RDGFPAFWGIDGADEPSFFQVGVLVPGIESASGELRRGLGVELSRPRDFHFGPYQLHVAYSRAEPYVELIEGSEAPWDSAAPQAVAWAVADAPAARAQLDDAGFRLAADGVRFGRGFTYHEGPESGLVVEIVAREGLLDPEQTFEFPG